MWWRATVTHISLFLWVGLWEQDLLGCRPPGLIPRPPSTKWERVWWHCLLSRLCWFSSHYDDPCISPLHIAESAQPDPFHFPFPFCGWGLEMRLPAHPLCLAWGPPCGAFIKASSAAQQQQCRELLIKWTTESENTELAEKCKKLLVCTYSE